MENQPTSSVYVKNISTSASEKTVTDFFGFCGKINSITLLKNEGTAEQEAIVEFQDVNAAKTAILLSNAMIVDRPITVSYHHPSDSDSTSTTQQASPQVTSVKKEEEIENKPNIPPASERSNTSVVASLLAAGYVLGSDAIQKAREYDEQYMISSSIKEQADALKEKVTELDTSLGISQTASSWATSASNFWEGLGLAEKAAMVRRGSANLVRSVGESEVVATTSATLSGVKETVVEVAGTIKEEAVKLMDEPALKVVSEKLHEGTEVVKGVAGEVEKGVKEVVEETTHLISSNLGTTSTSTPDDDALLVVLQEEEGAKSEQVNPPEGKEN